MFLWTEGRKGQQKSTGILIVRTNQQRYLIILVKASTIVLSIFVFSDVNLQSGFVIAYMKLFITSLEFETLSCGLCSGSYRQMSGASGILIYIPGPSEHTYRNKSDKLKPGEIRSPGRKAPRGICRMVRNVLR